MLITLSEFKRGLGDPGHGRRDRAVRRSAGHHDGHRERVHRHGGVRAPRAVWPGISAGIAEALITTAFGLMVAIPAVWLYNYFTTKIENLTVEMTYSSKELIDYLIKSVGQRVRPLDLHQGIPGPEGGDRQWPYPRVMPGRTTVKARHQRDADDRRDAGAADHLHDRDAADRRRVQGHDAEGQEPRPRPEGENEVVLGIDACGQLLPQRQRPVQQGTLEDQLKAMYAARTEDKILYFKADNQLQVRPDPGGGRDRPPGRRPGDGGDHRAQAGRASSRHKKEK